MYKTGCEIEGWAQSGWMDAFMHGCGMLKRKMDGLLELIEIFCNCCNSSGAALPNLGMKSKGKVIKQNLLAAPYYQPPSR